MSKKEKKTKKKTPVNGRTKRLFIKILAGLLCVIAVCTAVNAAVGKMSAGVVSQPENSYSDGSQNAGGYGNQSANIVTPNGNASDAGNNAAVNPNGGNSGAQQQAQANSGANNNAGANQQRTSGDPTSYDKTQIVSYYNQCLRKAYSQPSFTVVKTEKIDVQLGEMLINGKPNDMFKSIANRVVQMNAKDETTTKQFTNKNAVVDARERYILPANLTAAGVRSYTVNPTSGGGYVIKFVLQEERCNYQTRPPYNTSCTFPLDFNEIDLSLLEKTVDAKITSANFYYPGTTLTATIDGQGRVAKTEVVMPLKVDNASGSGAGMTVSIDIQGSWYGTNVNKF